MGFLGFESFAEFNTYFTFVLLGMSIMTVISAITSAPDFISRYYIYATGDPDAVCESPFFWKNANTFYNAGTYLSQVLCEPLALTRFVRRIPLRTRLIIALSLPFLEMLLIILTPVIKVNSQNTAIIIIILVSILGGFSKGLTDSSTNALAGPFPTKFMNGALWGLAVSAIFMSIVQVILKLTMGNSFDDINTQSRIYFSVAIFLQLLTLVQFLLLPRNTFAHRYAAEFRSRHASRCVINIPNNEDADNDDEEEKQQQQQQQQQQEEEAANNMRMTEEAPMSTEPVRGEVRFELDDPLSPSNPTSLTHPNDPHQMWMEKLKSLDDENEEDANHARAVILSHLHPTNHNNNNNNNNNNHGMANVLDDFLDADADGFPDLDQHPSHTTSTQQMLQTNLLSVLQRVYPMLIASFLFYMISLLIFPGVFFSIHLDDGWYLTWIVCLFNLGDFSARILLMWPLLRPRPRTVLIAAGVKLVLAIACVVIYSERVIHDLSGSARRVIGSAAFAYGLVTVHGWSTGYFGAMAMIHCPRTLALRTAGERAMASILAGIATMGGLCVGSNLAIAVSFILPK